MNEQPDQPQRLHEKEAIIRRAFYRSLGAMVIFAAIVATAIVWLQPGEDEPVQQIEATITGPVVDDAVDEPQPPPAGFPEVPEVQIPEPDVPQIEEQSAAVIPEPPIPVRVPEPEPELSIEIEAEQPPEAPAKDIPSKPDEAEIKRMIEERVEKIAWEVVPEMAEILIRETIEKIKGGS